MVVRFLPISEQAERVPERQQGELAEVIELRSRLPHTTAPADDAGGSSEQAVASATLRPSASAAAGASASARSGAKMSLKVQREGNARGDAADDAVRLLARRARSSGELRRELVALGHDSVEVEAVILDCEGSLYLDDLGLARLVCESLRSRKRASRAQIRMKLRERLLPDGVIEEVVAELDDEGEHELLREAATDRVRKLGGLDRQTAERRLLGFLARRGWGGERAMRVAREALDSAAARGTVRFR